VYTDKWTITNNGRAVSGWAQRYDFNRAPLEAGNIELMVDSVVIFETNKKLKNPEAERIIPLSIVAGVDVIMGFICMTNPKACFGSCPTFYLDPNTNFHYADAEGFSNAITPSMEYTDADAIGDVKAKGNRITLHMKNEALETHCVRSVRLGLVPHTSNESVYQSSDHVVWRSNWSGDLQQAVGPQGNITNLLRKADYQEAFTLANDQSLEHKEQWILEFPSPPEGDSLGLVLDFRQSLMTTYLIYNALAYMGDQVGDYFAQLERDSVFRKTVAKGIHNKLGGILVEAYNPQTANWESCGLFNETGPIAINRQLLPLPFSASGSGVRLRLTLNSGMWRIDRALLVNRTEKARVLMQNPVAVRNKGESDPAALRALENPNEHLLSMPGSNYAIDFSVPEPDQTYSAFLYSTGYYLEWIRADWLREKNPTKLHQLVSRPGDYFREEAKNYKRYEHTMEEAFWSSRIDTRSFTYHED
jgi:hypothetical protein